MLEELAGAAGAENDRTGIKTSRGAQDRIEEAHTDAPAFFDDQLLGVGERREHDRPFLPCARDQRPHYLLAGGIAVRVQDAATRMRGLTREDQLSAVAVELRSPIDELLDIAGALDDQRLDRLFVAKAGAGNERVFLVKPGIVVVREHDSDPALRVLGIGFVRPVFGEHRNVRARRGQLDRRPQSGDSATDDDKVGFEWHQKQFTKYPAETEKSLVARSGVFRNFAFCKFPSSM